MTLVSRLTTLKARLDKIPDRLGLPQYRNIVIRIKDQNTLPNGLVTENNTDILVEPKPRVVNDVRVGLSERVGQGVDIQLSDYTNSNNYKVTIVRTINVPTIEDIEFIILDPLFDNLGRVVGGIKCNLIYISDSKTVDWELVIQRVVDSGYTISPLNSVVI